MKKSIEFPAIDVKYWSEKNRYFSDTELSQTIIQGLEYAKRGRAIGPILESAKINSNLMLVNLIASRIQAYEDVTRFSDLELLIIFDLIQGWGGRTGRSPYLRPLDMPTRLSWKPLAETYRNSVKLCFEKNIDYLSCLTKLRSIPGIGESFATKHIFFWTEYGPRREALPIYDARIKLLLCLNIADAVDYDTFYAEMKLTAGKLKIAVNILERALFAFSQNYFNNSNLIIKSDIVDKTDIKEAENLQPRFRKRS